MIEGKLRELKQDPTSVQVIVQGTGDNSKSFLMDHEGIVVTAEAIIDSHVTEEITDTSLCIALRSEHGSSPSPTSDHGHELESVMEELCQTHMALDEERRISTSQSTELVLTKEKQRMKRIWLEKCSCMRTS